MTLTDAMSHEHVFDDWRGDGRTWCAVCNQEQPSTPPTRDILEIEWLRSALMWALYQLEAHVPRQRKSEQSYKQGLKRIRLALESREEE